jgi:hypothetical protein
MSDDKKFHKHEHKHSVKTNPRQETTEKDDDTVDAEEKWNPTPAVFEAFLVRDEELATGNIRKVLMGRRDPVSTKELRGSLLHSGETIDRVLLSGINAGIIQESKGEYSWVHASATRKP